MDDNRVSVITVDIIIYVANIDIQLEMPHDVGGQLDECTSTSFQINSLNLQTKFIFHKIWRQHMFPWPT